MTEQNSVRVMELALTAVLVGTTLALGGCGPKAHSRVANLPGEYHLVGGGLNISWQAPELGTVYLVEKKTGKLVETRTLQEGETYLFAVESVVRAEELQDMLGVDFSRTQFLLYFQPAGEKPTESARLTE